jgi:hypothetical protein
MFHVEQLNASECVREVNGVGCLGDVCEDGVLERENRRNGALLENSKRAERCKLRSESGLSGLNVGGSA